MSDTGPAAVITGDIVKSGALSDAKFEQVMTALSEASRSMADWPGAGRVAYEQFRGDGWQLWLARPALALRAACFMRAAIRTVCETGETRLAIGIGGSRRGSSLGASSGSAFERSGQALEALASHRLWAFGGTLGTVACDALADGLIVLCDERTQAWTARQAYMSAKLLIPEAPRMNQLAEAEGVQPQTVQTHFQRAGGHAIRDALAAFEQAANTSLSV